MITITCSYCGFVGKPSEYDIPHRRELTHKNCKRPQLFKTEATVTIEDKELPVTLSLTKPEKVRNSPFDEVIIMTIKQLGLKPGTKLKISIEEVSEGVDHG